MDFRELKQEDIEQLKGKSISKGILREQPETIDYSYCLEHEGKVLAIGGVRMINTTTAWGWVDISKESEGFIINVYRVIKEWMEILCKKKGITRLQAYVECDFLKAVRMVKHLGFHQENIMPCFVGRKSAYLYVHFFDEVYDGKANKQE